ncbi:DUF485 domain-containing protein [Streptomyces sp. KC 17012]|nr:MULTISPECIES: DUF485 domain-containing protein [Streptomyces]MBY8344665.1 DUF485 domain-containing protein [Streptomyces plumbidurans]
MRRRCADVNVEQTTRRAIIESAEFQLLRRAHRRSGVRMTSLAVGGFLLYVLLSGFAPGLMNTPLGGRLTLGLALGLGQFAVMAVIARRRLVHLRTHADPPARGFRTRTVRRHHERPDEPARRPVSHRAGGSRPW